MTFEELEKQIADFELKQRALIRQRDAADHQLERLTVKLQALRDAYAIIKQVVSGDAEVEAARAALRRVMTVDPETSRPVINDPDPWKDALIVLRKRGGRFTTDEVFDLAKERGSDIDRTRARSRLANLVDRKRIIRVRDGIFEFPKGETGT